MKANLGALILNVAVIHGAGLVLLSQSLPAQPSGGARRAPAVQVRLAQAEPLKPQPATATPVPIPAPATLADSQVPEPQSSELVPPPEQAATASPGQEAQVDVQASNLQAPVEEYIPRPRLSQPPQAATPVVVPFPAHVDNTGRFTAVLALFIDEDGTVRRVRIDDPSPGLSASMQDAARQAFLQTHFQPGQVQGQNVKSLIHVEVVFDNTPLAQDTRYRTM